MSGVDPIALEVLRCKLEAIAEDGSRTIMRNAISPLVADSGDCSCTIYDANGDMIVGGGAVRIHFHVGRHGIDKILELHGRTIADGDLFLVNDPYNGGGLHAQDVFIHLPVFHDGKLAAWVGTSAHMMDMGGMVPGSFSTSATEVYQEAFRVPPVRIYRGGVEQSDVWAIIRNNIRMAHIVEMDMRSLIAGANVVRDQLLRLVGEYGGDLFKSVVTELSTLTEAEVRRRIGELEPGTYSAASWAEWTNEFYHIPCALTVCADRLIFDFTGASPQTSHFLNSKPYVITTLLGVQFAAYLGRDLPFNEGVFRTFEVICEPGSILDAQAPAPIGGPHLDVGQTALETAIRALNYAIGASPKSRARINMAGPSASSGIGLHTLAGRGHDGEPVGWLMLDGGLVGASAGHDRDTPNMTYQVVGTGILETTDVEVLESWYPVMINSRAPRAGAAGAGTFCAGRSGTISYTVSGTDELSMTIMGNRERLPIAGMAGGLPGGKTGFGLRRAGSSDTEHLACHQDGIQLRSGDMILCELSSGGGWGDPLDRDPDLVAGDVRRGLLTAGEAETIFGVIGDNAEATLTCRAALRRDRLSRAEPALRPLVWTAELEAKAHGQEAALAIGVVQRGSVAVSQASGAPLAVSPNSWTDGCLRLTDFNGVSPDVDQIAYLDPGSGALLAVDVVPKGHPRSFEIAPQRWMEAA